MALGLEDKLPEVEVVATKTGGRTGLRDKLPEVAV